MPLFQQMRPVDAQLLRQVFRGYPLGNATQDQNHLDTRVPTAAPHGAREGIEHDPTFTAPIIRHRGAMAVMRLLPLRQRMPGGASQTIRMQNVEQIVIAFLFIHQFLKGKDHHELPGSVIRSVRPPFYQIGAI